MAKVLIDVSVISKDWFKRALEELRHSKSVQFLYSDEKKYRDEVIRVPVLARFLLEMRDRGRRVDAATEDVQRLMKDLSTNAKWNSLSRFCDDPHIFAILAVGNGGYVLTDEKRLALCRNCMSSSHKDICKFKAIRTEAAYKKARGRLMKS
jgi:predicted nucleic acid-binding protein